MSFLEFENVTLKFGGLTAVNDLSFSVEQGEVFAIVGPNGAGQVHRVQPDIAFL